MVQKEAIATVYWSIESKEEKCRLVDTECPRVLNLPYPMVSTVQSYCQLLSKKACEDSKDLGLP